MVPPHLKSADLELLQGNFLTTEVSLEDRDDISGKGDLEEALWLLGVTLRDGAKDGRQSWNGK